MRLGISLVPQAKEIFPNMTALENLEMGAVVHWDYARTKADLTWVYEFPVPFEKRRRPARVLSGGEQQMVVIGTICERETTIVLIEQNVEPAPKTSRCAYILKNGFTVVESESQRLIDRPEIRWAYLDGRPTSSEPASPHPARLGDRP
jgi:branched-chain amino acid transport system ATP-binding protein